MRKRKSIGITSTGISFISLLVFVAIIVTTLVVTSYNDHSYVVTISDKERVVTSSSGGNSSISSKYLIFCTDKDGNDRVLENTDSFLRFKFNSSDIYGQLEVGQTYQVTVVGYRIPFFSTYENIIEIEEISNE